MSKHTEGPWEVSKHATPDYAPQYGIYADGERNDLCTVKSENAEANARLIAACPCLLAACKCLLAEHKKMNDLLTLHGEGCSEDSVSPAGMAFAAINKATE